MVLDLDTKLQLGRDHVATSIGDETAVMSIKRSRYYAMCAVAERIWIALEQPISPREIIDQLVEEYDVTHTRCVGEVTDFIVKLIEEGLVVECRP